MAENEPKRLGPCPPLNNPPVVIALKNKTTGVKGGKFQPNYSFILDVDFKQLMAEWTEYRAKNLRKPFKTQRGFERQYSKLLNLSGGDVAKARAIANYCMDEEYRGFFPVPERALNENNCNPLVQTTKDDWQAKEAARKAAINKMFGGENGAR